MGFTKHKYDDYMLSVSAGEVLGQFTVNKFGQNPTISADSQEDIWDGSNDYTFPTTADITHIHQDTDQSTMRGQPVEIQGLNADWELTVQLVVLNATNTNTLVALTIPLIRVFRMKVLAGVVATQTITITNVGNTIDYGLMQAGNNQTLMAIYTVPVNCTAYMTKYYASITEATGKEPKSTEVRLWNADRRSGYEFQLKHAIGIPQAGTSIQHEFAPYMKIGQKTDIRMSAYCEDQIGNVSAGFDLIVIRN